MERIWLWFVEEPQRLVSAGRTAMRLGFVLFLAGMVGRIATALSAMTHRPAALNAIAPNWLTWFVPESVFGYSVAVLLFAAGAYLIVLGKNVAKMMGVRLDR